MSEAQLEKKVADYLCNSQALEDYWHRPLTAEQLQAEMDRMAKHTKQPEVLRELFEALGNDPYVIAECLARPGLSERLVASLDGTVKTRALRPKVIAAAASYTLPAITGGANGCTDDTWTATSIGNAPSARDSHTAVWTGSEMIVWGGWNGSALNTGGRYNPSTDTWAATSTTDAPSARALHTAVWTGSEMVIWGGSDGTNLFDTGGRYNPSTDSWTATSSTNAPAGRLSHTAVWTGTEMIAWGGAAGYPHYLNTGGRYSPSADSWAATSTNNAPAPRWLQTAVWTGSEMIVWGGSYLNTGGRYNPRMDTWTATSTTNAPTGRQGQAGVWTGSEMIVWGGYVYPVGDVNTGGRYNVGMDIWTAITIANAPAARDSHTAVWTGNEMIIWGGEDIHILYSNTGGRYNPSTDSWRVTSTTSAPTGRLSHTAVWSGNETTVWGGQDQFGDLDTGGRYCAQPSAPIVQSAVSQKTHGNAGSFSINLPLTGTPGIECRAGGATSDYTLVVTFLANVSVDGNPQAAVTLGSGTIGSGGVSNGGRVTIAGNVVTVPLTNVANAQTINVTLYSVNGSTNFVIPMSILIGDTNANRIVNASDVSQTKSRVGHAVDGTNFRSDVNADGYIDVMDVSQVKADVGTSLPP